MRADMENNIEYFIFIEELSRLRLEYHRCPHVRIREEISQDIKLLEQAINII
jgi:hypothetical protein